MYKVIWNSLLWVEYWDDRWHYVKAEIVMGDYTYMFYRDIDGTRTILRIPLADLK